jgi:hypothetical protein
MEFPFHPLPDASRSLNAAAPVAEASGPNAARLGPLPRTVEPCFDEFL